MLAAFGVYFGASAAGGKADLLHVIIVLESANCLIVFGRLARAVRQAVADCGANGTGREQAHDVLNDQLTTFTISSSMLSSFPSPTDK
jgi:hypothetical protein